MRHPLPGEVTAVEARRAIKRLAAALYKASRVHKPGTAIRIECAAALAEAAEVREKLREQLRTRGI